MYAAKNPLQTLVIIHNARKQFYGDLHVARRDDVEMSSKRPVTYSKKKRSFRAPDVCTTFPHMNFNVPVAAPLPKTPQDTTSSLDSSRRQSLEDEEAAVEKENLENKKLEPVPGLKVNSLKAPTRTRKPRKVVAPLEDVDAMIQEEPPSELKETPPIEESLFEYPQPVAQVSRQDMECEGTKTTEETFNELIKSRPDSQDESPPKKLKSRVLLMKQQAEKASLRVIGRRSGSSFSFMPDQNSQQGREDTSRPRDLEMTSSPDGRMRTLNLSGPKIAGLSPVKPMPRESKTKFTYGSMRSYLGADVVCKSEAQRARDEGLESSGDDEEENAMGEKVKKIHELKESGEMKRFIDEMTYIMDGLTSSALSMQQSSFIQLIRNLTADAFLIKFRSSNWLPEVYQATANISDTTMKNLVVQYIGIVGQESRSMKHLLSQTSVSVESLIASAFDLRSKAPSTKREKRFAQEIQEIPLPGIIDMRNWALLPFKHLLKLYAANDSLSSDGMKCVDKTRQYFLSLDVIKCKRQELLLCIECLELSSSISDDARRIMANDDRFIDQLVIVHSQSNAVEDDLNQAVMRVFLNLTQGDANVSQMLSRKTNFVKTILTCAFFCVGSEHQGQAQVDVSMLSVGLLVNLLEYCPALKISIGSMVYCSSCASCESCSCKGTIKVLEFLARNFLSETSVNDEVTTTLTGAYMAVLLGSLVTSCPKNRRTISAHLPSLEPLALMIEEFIEFQKTLLQVNENASCMGRQSQKILTMLHSMVQELRT